MRRFAVSLAALAALSVDAAALAQAPPLAARLAACETGAAPADRFAVFSGAMPRRGAAVMAMRFDLFERIGDGAWERVPLPNWGVWERTARRDVPGFIFTKRVERLAAPARFRARISFRWSDEQGRVLDTAERTTRTCRQPDQRPDLVVASVVPGDEADERTRVVVANRGRGDAGAFAVTVARGGQTRTKQLAGLPAGERATLTVPIGGCAPGDAVRVSVDPQAGVEEASEANNDASVTCGRRR